MEGSSQDSLQDLVNFGIWERNIQNLTKQGFPKSRQTSELASLGAHKPVIPKIIYSFGFINRVCTILCHTSDSEAEISLCYN